jgi:exodeoxyribonuclease III
MRLVTWNVNSLRARLPRLLEFLEQHGPDVVCLQETKSDPEGFPHAELAEAGYHGIDHSGGRWAGVALLTREGTELADPVRGLAGEPAELEARWVEATVDGIRVASVYVPNGRALGTEFFEEKLAFLDAAASRANAMRERGPVIIAGDMNVAPADLDVYDPVAFVGETHVTEDERSRLDRMLGAGGLVDAFRALHPDEPGFTWWDYRAGHFHRGMGLRIDLFLVSDQLLGRVLECGIDRNYRKGSKPSDHAPLLLDLVDE